MATTTRKRHEPAEKVAIIRRHLVDQVPISDLCDELGIKPTQYYAWQKQFFEQGAAAFQVRKSGRGQQNRYEKKIAALEEKLNKKNEVVAELLEEHVQLKKDLGEL